MIKEKITIDELNQIVKIENIPEDPFLSIQIITITNSSLKKQNQYAELSYIITDIRKNQEKHNVIFYATNPEYPFFSISSGEIICVEFELQKCTLADFKIELEVKKGRDLITVRNSLISFRDFIDNRVNSRILFSGAFGQGKTTFLNFFFEEAYKNDYTVFRVFPVNYSIASNEDIFRYIKSDILFQLLGCNVEFDMQEINIIQSFQEYAYLNPKETLFSFLKMISNLNTKTSILTKSLGVLNSFLDKIQEYQKNETHDDSKYVRSYLQEIYEREGSLFEDNFYTQLIRQLLERIKKNSKKSSILIIEDLDRMDPDHIFRILNVISAHYDTYKFNEETGNYNKFGFDKIILVCDIDNIRHIFHHKYGEKTDFEGYINKYYSSTPYYFNNIKNILNFIESQLEVTMSSNKKYLLILKILLSENQLSLRELLKLMLNDFNLFYVEINRSYLRKGPFTKPLAFLSNIYTPEILINKFEILKNSMSKNQVVSYNEECGFLIAALCESHSKNVTAYNNFYCHFKYQEQNNEPVFSALEITKRIRIDNGGETTIPFNKIDFYNLLIENVKKIKESI